MPFTQEQLTAVMGALQKRPTMRCVVCGQQSWNVNSDLVLLQTVQVGIPLMVATGAPSVAVICTVCGNTLLFNVFALGVGDIFGLKASRS